LDDRSSGLTGTAHLNKESIGSLPLTDALFLFFPFPGGAARFFPFLSFAWFSLEPKEKGRIIVTNLHQKGKKTLTWAQKKGMIRFVTIL